MISVVVTCYNYGVYLADCVGSVLGQSERDLEVIIVNDGSQDRTDEIATSLARDERIRYVKQRNRGQARAKNVGLETARGEYVAFLDADDLWKPEKLEKQRTLFRRPSVGVVFSRADYIDVAGKPLPPPERGKHLAPSAGNVTSRLIFDNFVPFSTSVIRRELALGAGGFDESLEMGIDWDLWLRLSVVCEFDYVDEPLVDYRLGHAGQMSRNLELRQRCADRIVRKFLAANPGLLASTVIRRAQAYRHACRGYRWRSIDLGRSNRYYRSALRYWLLEPAAYKGLLRNAYVRFFGART